MKNIKLYGLEKKADLQELKNKIDKTIKNVVDASSALVGLSLHVKSKSISKALVSRSISVENISRYLYDMYLKITKHLKNK